MQHYLRFSAYKIVFMILFFSNNIFAQAINDVTLPGNDRVSKDNSIEEANVDLSTGVIAPSIHLMDLKGKGNLNVSLDLVYIGGQGLKVSDVAGRFGWGWDINAGGTITREVRGIRDEEEHNNPIYATDGMNKFGWLDNIDLAENHILHFEIDQNTPCGVVNLECDVDGNPLSSCNGNSYSSWCLYNSNVNTSTDICGGYPIVETVENYHCNIPSESHMVGGLVNFFHQSTPPSNYNCPNCWWLAIEKYFINAQSDHQYTDYTIDSESDIYHFNFGGYSGQFIFDENGYPQLMPQQDIKIEPAIGPHKVQYGSVDSWIFTTPDGIRYVFKNSDLFTETTILGRDYGGTANTNAKEYVSTWHLSSIVDADDNSITFSYTNDGWRKEVNGGVYGQFLTQYTLSQMEPEFVSGNDIDAFKYGNTSAHCAVPFQYTDQASVTPKSLSSINSDYGSISFINKPFDWVYVTSHPNENVYRKDIYHFIPNQASDFMTYFPMAEGIKLFDAKGNCLKQYSFDFSYVGDYTINCLNARLNLDNLYQVFPKPLTYSFSYKPISVTNMSERRYDADRWGFYNSQNRVTGFTPFPSNAGCMTSVENSLIVKDVSNGFNDGAERNPNGTSSQEGIIDQITFPTGAIVKYDFEGNNYFNGTANVDWGGLRIHTVTKKSSDTDPNPLITEYRYVDPQVPSSSSGTVQIFSNGQPFRKQFDIAEYFKANGAQQATYSLRYSNPNREIPADFIRYSNVEIIKPGFGKTSYEFTNFNDHGDDLGIERKSYECGFDGISPGVAYSNDIDNDAGAPFNDRSYERGLLKKITKFKASGGNYFKIEEIENTYEFNGNTPVEISGVRINAGKKFYEPTTTFHLFSYFPVTFNVEYYNLSSQWIYLKQVTTKTYGELSDGTVTSIPLQKDIYYYYDNPDHKQLTRIKWYDSDNTEYISNIKYPKDFSYSTSPQDPESFAMNTLMDKHIDNAVVENFISMKKPGGNTFIIGATSNRYGLYGEFPQNVNSAIHYPQQLWKLELDAPLSTFSEASIVNGTYSADPHYGFLQNNYFNSNGEQFSTSEHGEFSNSTMFNHLNGNISATFDHALYQPLELGNECSYIGFEGGDYNTGSVVQPSDDFWNFEPGFIYPSATFPYNPYIGNPHSGNSCLRINPKANSADPTIYSTTKEFQPLHQDWKYKFSAWVNSEFQFSGAILVTCFEHEDGSFIYNSNGGLLGWSATDLIFNQGSINTWKYYENEVDFKKFREDNAAYVGSTEKLRVRCYFANTHVDHFLIQCFYIDDVSFRPSHSGKTFVNYNTLGLISSTIDNRNQIKRMEYNNYGDLTSLLDENGYVLSNLIKHDRQINNPNDHSYTKTINPTVAVLPSNIGLLSDAEKAVSITYQDGFGRLEQSIGIKQSPTGNDVVNFHKYDNTGLEPIRFLPYISQFNDGSFQDGAVNDQAIFYQPGASNTYASSDFPFMVTVNDNSPLNRILEQGGTDAEFQPGSGHTKTMNYVMNFDQNEIPEFSALQNGASAMNGNNIVYYPLYSLLKIKTIDEEGKEVRSYSNKNGKSICKRVRACTESGTDETEDFTVPGAPSCQTEDYYTFYIYNDLGQLVYELPMVAYRYLQKIGNLSFTENDPVFIKWINGYKYDERGRVVETFMPGKGRTYTVYNKYNQPVLTQSENQRVNHDWSFVKYDYKGRIIYTGIYNDSRSRSAIQTDFNLSGGDLWEDKGENGNGFPVYGYTNASIPNLNLNGSDEIYTVNYFDNYEFDTQNQNYTSTISVDKTDNTFGLLTGTFIKILASNPAQYLLSVNYYDSKTRLIQQRQQNHLGGWDVFDNLFQFDGRLLKTYRNHTVASAVIPIEVNIRNEYDDGGRLLNVFEKIDYDPEILLCSYVYNDLGQVIQKNLHYDPADASFLQRVDYRYNIKGWLTSINNATLSDDGGVTNGDDYDAFGEEIYYYGASIDDLRNRVTVTPDVKPVSYYDGKIAATIWKSQVPGAGQIRYQNIYTYRYDDFNRMTGAHYVRENDTQNGIFDIQSGIYDELLHYDLNGNIKKLLRNSKAGTIDDLTYSYLNDGNQLDRVDDNPGTIQLTSDFHDGASSSGEYHYDVNGNIIKDDNKDITTVYNYLNLPVTVTKGQDVLTYTYDAMGRKLSVASPSGVHDFISGFEYDHAHLQLITTRQGRVRPRSTKTLNTTQYVYDYFIKDHLGNVRSIITEEQIKDDYSGTLEVQNAAAEESVFENVVETRDTKPSGEPSNPDYSPDNKVSALNGSEGTSIGISKTLHVMQGDMVDIDAKYYFENLQPESNSVTVNELLTTLANIFIFTSNSPAGTLAEAQQSWANSTFTGNQAVNDFLVNAFGSSVVNDPDKPQAFLVYLFFDENFNFYPMVSGLLQVQDANTLGDLAILNLKIPENGYLYIYTNNESSSDVNFNDMRIAHYKGRVIEEDHYYPYGMFIEPLSWVASDFTKNGYKYQDKNLQTQLEYYHEEFFFRHYDPALGRWNVTDPMGQYFNPYLAMGDNPVNLVDPLGSWVHMGPSDNGISINEKAEEMRNVQRQLTQMGYNAAMAGGTPGGGGMPFVMNRGGSYWLAPSQEQLDWMAISGSTVMAGNGQVFSINSQGELILGHYEQTNSPLYQVNIYGDNGSMATFYTDGSTPTPIQTGGFGITSEGFMVESGISFIQDLNLGNILSNYAQIGDFLVSSIGSAATSGLNYTPKYSYRGMQEIEAQGVRFLSKIEKVTKGISQGVNVLTTAYSASKVMTQMFNGGLNAVDTWDLADAAVGTIGIYSGYAIAMGLAAGPIGWGALLVGAAVYGIGRAVYDIYTEP